MLAEDIEVITRAHNAPPLFALTSARTPGITVARWKRDGSGHASTINCSIASYCIAMTLRPMQANGWYGKRKFVSGQVESNSFRITPPNSSLRWHCEGEFDILLLAFDNDALQSITGPDYDAVLDHLARIAGPENLPGPSYIRDDVSAAIGRQIVNNVAPESRYSTQFVEGISYGLVARLLGRYVEAAGQPFYGGLSPAVLKRVRDYIFDNLGDDLRVADLAEVAGMSVSHFAHAFSDVMGVSPYRFANEARIQHAATLLRDTERTVLSVALDCGFKDPSHFTRSFRSVLGMTPRSYRLAATENAS